MTNTRSDLSVLALSLLLAALALTACDKPAAAPAPAPAPAGGAPAAPAPTPAVPTPAAPTDGAKKDEVKMSKELWPNGKLKYTYEMRRGASGKWDRNGIGRAYFDTGELEREGMYKDGVRVGQWKYFKPDGTIDRIEERGSDGKGGA